ncbi:MAG: PKD domain-containing protein [Tannerellaceae bacterium]|nr:PKD domain-containing protein [Tannerellaceae bacterium]
MKKHLLIILFTVCLIEITAQRAGFTISQPSKCAPSTVGFTNTSSGNPLGYMWIFGDGFTSVNTNPTHPYTNAGIYTVQLIVSYPNSVSDTAIATVEVLALPAFSFTKLNDSICPEGTVSFTSSVSYPSNSNAVQSYSWDFGDGGLASSANPTHQYMNVPNQPVLYHVSLTVTDTNGCSRKVDTSNYIFVKAKPMPEFTIDKPSFCIPDTPGIVQFTNQTTVTNNNSYLWTFSDGGSSTLENPSYSFSRVGSYAVSLTATSDEGCTNMISKANLIEVIHFVVQRSVSDTIICSVPNDVTFRGLIGSNVDYSWDFGDGENGNSSFLPITHKYNSSGTYLATVIANYRNGTCFAYDTMTIHAYDDTVVAQMLITDSLLCSYEYDSLILFENVTQYPVPDDFGFAYTIWYFGDGDSAVGAPVYHQYSNDTDHYHVTMQSITPYGCPLKEIAGNIWFHSFMAPWLKGVWSDEDVSGFRPLGGCLPFTVTTGYFQYPHPANPDPWDIPAIEYIFDWGDGSPFDTAVRPPPSTPPIPFSFPSHTYTDTGDYYVLLTYINEIGCTYTDSMAPIRVGIPPAAGFTFRYQEQCFRDFLMKSPLFVQAFDSLDINGVPVAGTYTDQWFWLDSRKEPVWLDEVDTAWLRADDTGYVTIVLVPYHNGCPGDTIVMDSVSYACPPTALFITDGVFDDTVCGYPATLELNSSSKGATAYKWYFGDAENFEDQSSSTEENPTFVYPHSTPFLFKQGIYPGIRITLVTYNDDSINTNSPTYNRCGFCTDTAIFNLFIPDGFSDFKCSPNICQGDTVYFYDSGAYNSNIFFWDFTIFPSGEKYSSNILTDEVYYAPSDGYPVVFRNSGNMIAMLNIEDEFGCKYGDTVAFSVYPQSVPTFTTSTDGINFFYKADTLCANDDLSRLYFKDASYTNSPFDTASIVEWSWRINKDTFAVQNPVLKDSILGLHNIELYIVNEYGCASDSVFENQILVNEVTAAFYPARAAYCNHTEVEFNNVSYISPYEHNRNTKFICTWDFGDGSPPYTQTGIQTVYHTYHLPKGDTVYITLTVTTDDRLACSETYTNTVIITGPTASFTDDGSRFPCPDMGRQVQFHSTSTGNPVWYYWNFGDTLSNTANESNLKEPIHDYLRAGDYDIIHVVRDSVGCMDSVVSPKHVFIDGPIGNFQYGELSGCVDHRVAFIPSVINTDTIIVNPDRASQIVAGGTHVNDTLYHTYQLPGSYLPYFYLITWTNNNGTLEQCIVQWTGTDSIYAIDVIPDFETDSVYCSSSPVVFPNRTTLAPDYVEVDSVIWSFGNGDTLNAIDGYTQYDAVGTYTVVMTVYAKYCSKQISKQITVIELPERIATGPDSATACENDINILFTADTIPNMSGTLQYQWVFEDGDTIEGNPANKIFGSSGIYAYQVIVSTDISNCTKTYFDTIIIYAHSFPTAEFEANPQTVNYGEEIQFIDKSAPGKGTITSWYWDFGDTTNANEQNTAHTYVNSSGYFTVLLRIEDEFGCRDSVEHEVLVLESIEFPNLLTPVGSDGRKYVFRPLEEKGYFKEFQIEIYNRWGNPVWKNTCTAPNCPDYADSFWWDGCNKQGKPVVDGVYYWVVSAVPLSGTKPVIKNGSVTVINNK